VGYGFEGNAQKLGATIAKAIRTAELSGRQRGNYSTKVDG